MQRGNVSILPPIDVLACSLLVDGDGVTCDLDSLRRLGFLAMQGVPIDEQCYLETHPDVRQAIADGHVAYASDHYPRSGYLEGRMSIDPHVDEAWYCRIYPEVGGAMEAGTVVDASTHFIESGWREGRQPGELPVDPRCYTTAYSHAQQRMAREIEGSAGQGLMRRGYFEGLAPFRHVFRTMLLEV